MTTTTQTHSATQPQQEKTNMPNTFATNSNFDIKNKEQSMSYPSMNFLVASPTQDKTNDIIVHSKDAKQRLLVELGLEHPRNCKPTK